MFKYTPNKKLLKELLKSRKTGYNSKLRMSNDRVLAVKYFSGEHSFLIWTFLKKWEHVCFYSEAARTTVPVNGYQFPVEYFEEEKV